MICYRMWLLHLHSMVKERERLFPSFPRWWILWLVDFIGYSLGISGNKASAISYGTAKLIRSKAFCWSFLWNFKERSANPFLWHGLGISRKRQPFLVAQPPQIKKTRETSPFRDAQAHQPPSVRPDGGGTTYYSCLLNKNSEWGLQSSSSSSPS